MKKRLFLLTFIALFSLTGCNFINDLLESANKNYVAKTVKVTGVNILKDSTTIQEGDSETLEYVVLPADATNNNVFWSSKDENIASVIDGTVLGKSVGETTITVTTVDGKFKDTCSVNITEKVYVPVEGVCFTQDNIEIEAGQTTQLEYYFIPDNPTNKNVSWFSTNQSVATVENGLLTALTPGTAKIVLSTEDGPYSAECYVTVVGEAKVSSFNIIKSSVDVEVGNDVAIQYSIYPTNATNKNVIWSSSNQSVATVEDGVVHAISEGITTITGRTEDENKYDSCVVNVISAQPQDDDPTKNGEFYGGLVSGSKYSGYEFSKSKTSISKPSTGFGEINVYAFNDFHGSIVRQKADGSTETGLKQIATMYKEKSQEENTLIFDQGDTWQGSFESNYDYGGIIQDVFTYAGVTARTVGNHDFDWGINHLVANSERTYNDDYIPCLAANVYDYSNGVVGNEQQSQIGKEYCTYVLDNGIKIGVVGVIGEDQITSISSQFVSEISFTDYVEKIKELSDFLRTSKGCDVIIATTHEGSGSGPYSGLHQTSSKTGKRYADLVLGGHSHYVQEYTENGVKYVQWNSNGVNTGKVTLKYNFTTGELVDDDTEVNTYYSSYYDYYYPVCEPKIAKMIDTYLDSVNQAGDEVLSTKFSGVFDTSTFARLMSEAVYSRVSKSITDLKFACVNYARSSFSGTTLTYRDLYKCFPFDNQIILLDVSSTSGKNSLRHNFTYKEDTSLYTDSEGPYRSAVIDYVALHQNYRREYDYFPEAENGFVVFNDTMGDPPTYRDILYSYLKANSTKTFNASDYSWSNPHFL